MKHIVLISMLLLCASLFSFAQKTLKGKIFDAANLAPLPGATISFGKSNIVTGADGTFSIDCSKTGALTISYIGYEKMKRKKETVSYAFQSN